MNTEFNDWLYKEMERRNWSQSDLAKKADLGRGTISNVLNNVRKPGPEICVAIAKALNLPPVQVFEKAGLLPPSNDPDPQSTRAIHVFLQLPEHMRLMFGEMFDAQLIKLQNETTTEPKTQPRPPGTGPLKDNSKA